MSENPTTNPKPADALIHASSYSCGPERAGDGRGKLPDPELVIWCREHSWEAAGEITRLRSALAEIVKATDAGAYFTARRAAAVAIEGDIRG